jgi:TonB family protein
MYRRATSFISAIVLCVSFAFAQQEIHPGIGLYRNGNNPAALSSLSAAVKSKEHKNNAQVWEYLGLAYQRAGDAKKARQALEKAAKLDPSSFSISTNLAFLHLAAGQTKKAAAAVEKAIILNPKNAAAYYLRGVVRYRSGKLDESEQDADQALLISSSFGPSYVLKSYIFTARFGRSVTAGESPRAEVAQLKSAVDWLRSGIEKCKTDCTGLRQELETIAPFFEHYSRQPAVPGPTGEDVVPFTILSKPKAAYTDEARRNGTTGVVRMAVLFGASGRVERVLMFNRLGSGLDESALRAVSQIKFEPKRVNGQPVPVVKTVEYGFTIY